MKEFVMMLLQNIFHRGLNLNEAFVEEGTKNELMNPKANFDGMHCAFTYIINNQDTHTLYLLVKE